MASKRKILSLKEEVELINFAKNGKGCRDIAKEFDIGKTHASLILKRQAEIRLPERTLNVCFQKN